jgi:phospholipid/cholesterol/gamma-HCH transport system substrate-binding protein
LDSIQAILQKVEKGEGALGKLIADEKVAEHLSNAAKNIEELTIDLKKHPWKLMRKEKRR